MCKFFIMDLVTTWSETKTTANGYFKLDFYIFKFKDLKCTILHDLQQFIDKI